ncbi:MAG: BlaI/MecI/CopY family transcriptional regulator [Planctomycetota bacterium]
MSDPRQLGGLQLAILRVLWGQGEATVSAVHEALREERGLAPTTIATMLSKLEKRGLVSHRVEGRQFIYQACHAEEEVHRFLVSEFVERAFLGDPAALLNHLLTECDLGPDDLQRMREMIAEQRRCAGGDR